MKLLNENEFNGINTVAKIMTAAEKAEAQKKTVNGKKSSPINQPSTAMPQQKRQVDFPLRILVQSEMVGAIIGRGGQTIRQITLQSR